MPQGIKDPALPQLWPGHGNFHMLWVQPKKKKVKHYYSYGISILSIYINFIRIRNISALPDVSA